MKIKKFQYIIFSLLSFAVLLFAFCTIEFFINETKLDNIQKDAITELTENKGQYNENTIVLNNTSLAKSKKISELIGAELRTNKDGSFATLTLPSETKLEDIYSNEKFKHYLKDFSLDYYSEICDTEEEYTREQVVSRPETSFADKFYSYQTYLDYLNVCYSMEQFKGNGVKVAIIDSGIDYTHEDIGNISTKSYNATTDKVVEDFDNDWSIIQDDNGHGTAVAGVLRAQQNNAKGIVGIAPYVELIVIKSNCDAQGRFYNTSDLVFGIYYAIEVNADIINMSFSGSVDAFSKATELAYDSDIVCVAAAGNDSSSIDVYPACSFGVLGVGALEQDSWELASYSNYGGNVDIVAPGTVYTCIKGGTYGKMIGTSFSAPIVSGAIALLEEKHLNYHIEPSEVIEYVETSSFDLGQLGKDYTFGFGALDMRALIQNARVNINYDYLCEELENETKTFCPNRPLQEFPEPTRDSCVFDGWYYDIYCTEEVNYFEDAWNNEMTLYASWKNEEDTIPYTYRNLSDGTVEITSYIGHRRYISLPNKIGDKIVTSISDGAFQGKSNLRVVNLPDHLKRIGTDAFKECTGLTYIKLPETLTVIEKNAFKDCAHLSDVIFTNKNNLERIGDYAFANTFLREFKIGEKVNDLNGSCFSGTTRLKKYIVDSKNESFYSTNAVLYDAFRTKIVAYPAGNSGEFTIPDSVHTLGSYSFAYTKINEIELNNVRDIGAYAFDHAELEKIDLKNSVKSLGRNCFSNCNNLEEVEIGTGIRTISLECFRNCNSLKSITIGDNVEVIENYAFTCSSLNNIDFAINGKLVSIGEYAFAGTNLESVCLPNSLMIVDDYSFSETTSLKSVDFGSNSNVKYIGKYAFYQDRNLSNVILPPRLKTIDESAFEECRQLSTIIFPESLETIGTYAFKNSGLSDAVIIPKNVKTIEQNPFADCSKISKFIVDYNNEIYRSVDGVVYTKERTSYTISGEITKPSTYALVLCPCKYSSSNLPLTGMEIIEKSAFEGCTAQQIVLSDCFSLKDIREKAFCNCRNLSTFTIPAAVTQIGRNAFSGDEMLHEIIFDKNSIIKRFGFEAFSDSGIIQIHIPNSITSIGQYAFSNCANLKNVYFEDGSNLENISGYVFNNCFSLETINFGTNSSLKNIEAHGFENIYSLRKIDLSGSKLESIGNFAFRYCLSLNEIKLPDTLTYIGRYAFFSDELLETIFIPTNVQYIGRYAFFTPSNAIKIIFSGNKIPSQVQECWDEGIKSYSLGVNEYIENDEWEYTLSNNGDISLMKYKGANTNINLVDLDLGGNIVSIGGYAFYGCEIDSIILPESLDSIQQYAFSTSSIKTITIPENVTYIGRNAFENCDSLTTFEFAKESKINLIDKYAFSSTDCLNGINFPASLSSLGSFAFYRSAISSITFDDEAQIKEISANTFSETKIKKINLPRSIEKIDSGAFRNTTTLTEVTFNSDYELTVMDYAFYNTNIKALYIPQNLTFIGEYAFVGLQNLDYFEVDEQNKFYTSINGVLFSKDLKKIISFPGNVRGSYVIPNTVISIGFGAFENTKLDTISFEEGTRISNIGFRAFFNADNLETLDIPDSVISIEYYAFGMCDNLTTVTFGSNSKLMGIYEGVFYHCKSLINIVIPSTVVEIGNYAFYGDRLINRLPVDNESSLLIIGNYAFAYTGIKSFESVPDSIIYYGNYSFAGIDAENIIIPNNDDLEIGIGMLYDCGKLSSLTLPFIGRYLNDVETSIGWIFGSAGYNANPAYIPDTLTELYVTGNLEAVGQGAFYGLSNIVRGKIPNTITTLYNSSFKTVRFPYEFKDPVKILDVGKHESFGPGLTGTLILDDTTYMIEVGFNYNLNTLYLPNSIRNFSYTYGFIENVYYDGTIEEWMQISFNYHFECNNFYYKSNGEYKLLEQLDLDEASPISKIGKYQFASINSLKVVNIHCYIDYFGKDAFYGCKNLTEIIIPEGVVSISQNDIGPNVEKITLPSTLQEIDIKNTHLKYIINNSNLEIKPGDDGLGKYASLVVNKDGSISKIEDNKPIFIDDKGFVFIDENDELTLIDYYGGERIIELPRWDDKPYSFNFLEGKLNVDKVIIPDCFTEIPDNAFENCEFKEIYIPSTVKTIGSYSFYNCVNLKIVVFNEGLETIGQRAFYLTSIEEISFPNSLRTIDAAAFAGNFQHCSVIRSVNFGNGVEEIGEAAFSYCDNLKDVVLPDSITTLGRSLFANCNLNSITLGANVESVSSVFINCDVKNISISADNPYLRSFEGSLYNSTYTELMHVFEYKKTYVIPKSVEVISKDAFKNVNNAFEIYFEEGANIRTLSNSNFHESKIAKIVIPKSITSIGEDCFMHCSYLESVIFENGSNLYIIYDYAFYYAGIKEIELPESLKIIRRHAFDECRNLTSIHLPESLDYIEYNIICNCPNLEDVILPKSIATTSFSGVLDKCPKAKYVIPEGITIFSGIDFAHILKNIGIPSSLRVLGENCGNSYLMENLEIPNQIEEIKANAFTRCSFNVLQLPISVLEIESNSFSDCSVKVLENNSDIDIDIDCAKNLGFKYVGVIKNRGDILYEEPEIDVLSQLEYKEWYQDTYQVYGIKSNSSEFIFPKDINGKAYSINFWYSDGTQHVVPDRIVIPEGRCKEVQIRSTSVRQLIIDADLDKFRLWECRNLTCVEGKGKIKDFDYIGDCPLDDYYVDGVLYLMGWVLDADSNIESFVQDESSIGIYTNAFRNCPHIKTATITTMDEAVFYNCQNLETLIINTPSPDRQIIDLFYSREYSPGLLRYLQIPFTLKNVVLTSKVYWPNTHLFDNLNVRIFVENDYSKEMWKKDCRGWNNENRVYFLGEWTTASFYTYNHELINKSYISIKDVIMQPYVKPIIEGDFNLIFDGWDTNNDGIGDFIPATTNTEIIAKAIMKPGINTYSVAFIGMNNEVIQQKKYTSQEIIKAPTPPFIQGYTFKEWKNYINSMTVDSNAVFQAVYEHDGGGHNYIKTTINPTCQHDGYDLYTCTICGNSYVENVIEKVPHQHNGWILDYDSDCVNHGHRHYVCLLCGETIEEEIDPSGHNFVEQVLKEPTCCEEGSVQYTCSTCGISYVKEIDCLEHHYVLTYGTKSFIDSLTQTVGNVYFGEDNNGSYFYKCDACGQIRTYENKRASSSTASLNSCSHQRGEWELQPGSNCIDKTGFEVIKCNLCGEILEVRSIDANESQLIHNFDDKVIENYQQPRCTEEGHYDEVIYCHDCNIQISRTTIQIPATGHTVGEMVVEQHINPTCTESGSYFEVTYCKECGQEISRIERKISPTGHTFGEWIVIKEATTSEKGEKERKCSVCGHVEKEEINPIPKPEAKKGCNGLIISNSLELIIFLFSLYSLIIILNKIRRRN